MNGFSDSLLSLLIRGTLVLSAAAVVLPLLLRVLRCGSADVHRFGVCLVLLLGWLAPGIGISVPLPGWAALRHTTTQVGTSHPAMPGPHGDESQSANSREARGSQYRAAIQRPRAIPVDRDLLAQALPGGNIAQARASADQRAMSLASWLVIGWGAGCLFVITRWVIDYACLSLRFSSAGTAELDPQWVAEWELVQRQTIRESSIPMRALDGADPMVCRVPKGYRLVVPAGLWEAMSREQRLGILWHEAAHVQRGDLWKSLMVRILALPYWFNPLTWRAVRLFDEYAEWACDDAVRRSAAGPVTEYARALLCVSTAAPRALLQIPAARKGGVAQRIRRLLIAPEQEDSMMKKMMALIAVTGLGLAGLVRFDAAAGERQEAGGSESPALQGGEAGRQIGAASSAAAATTNREPDRARADQRRVRVRPVDGDSAVELELEDEASVGDSPRTASEALPAYWNHGLEFYGDQGSHESYRIHGALDASTGQVLGAVDAGGTPARQKRKRSVPEDEAVIDMSHLFKHLDEVERGRAELRAEIQGAERLTQHDQKVIIELQRRLQNLDDANPDSRQLRYSLESELIERKAKFEARRAADRKRFLKSEADLFYSAYRRITDEVSRYAREHGIRIVRRSGSGGDPGVKPEDPKKVMELLNRDVVFIDQEPLDITAEILERLNRRTAAAAEARD